MWWAFLVVRIQQLTTFEGMPIIIRYRLKYVQVSSPIEIECMSGIQFLKLIFSYFFLAFLKAPHEARMISAVAGRTFTSVSFCHLRLDSAFGLSFQNCAILGYHPTFFPDF